MIRTFIALDLPPAVQESLEHLCLDLQRTGAAVSWVKPGRIHVTVKFLGNVPTDRIDAISDALLRSVAGTKPFRLRPAGCGAFPSMKKMRIVWVGLQGDLDPLKTLQRQVEDVMASLGFNREDRAFKPHLTLGRVKGAKNIHALQEALLDRQGFQLEAFDVTEAVLYKSELRPEGARYTPLFRAQFSPQ